MQELFILSGGAAKGLTEKVMQRAASAPSFSLKGEFGAVGLMREKFLDGEPCDLLILTAEIIRDLEAQNKLVANSITNLGVVHTGVAVKEDEIGAEIVDGQSLRQVLVAASEIYFPDPERATAGIHFANVLNRLGLLEQLGPKLRAYPNGATAMAAMAESGKKGAIGCTQNTEILYTPGVKLVGDLPAEYALSTTYTAAIPHSTSNLQLARQFIDLLVSEDFKELRQAGGFN